MVTAADQGGRSLGSKTERSARQVDRRRNTCEPYAPESHAMTADRRRCTRYARRLRPGDVIGACEEAHRRLFEHVESLDDDAVRAPSLLPGWTRAHVITHLARNADSHTWLFEGAALGEVRQQYPTLEARDRDIRAGATRTADRLRSDLYAACERLERAWATLPDDGWDREGIVVAGARTMGEVVFRRLREVSVHHVDLDVGFTPKGWSTIYVEGELARRLGNLADRADHVALVLWLLGRADAPELSPW
jgi:maleylpyruvate isomerase